MAIARRLLWILCGGLLILPVACVDDSGQQLGLGLYLAFIGMPIGIFLVGIGLFNYQEPPGLHGPTFED